ncbi:MAG: glycyl-radical enzyme activating protein [Coprothermobacterota bacterium]|nr:glycyl-radical enzyme activating protein [Coprothermobacterota bacterium]
MQRYSTQDGPGIRTTVFLKGCPLRCPWCHNPENQDSRPELLFRMERCLGCGDCRTACPQGAIYATESGFLTLADRCLRCGACATACPTGARHLVGERTSVADVLDEVEKDHVFYDQSGGGVTFSGGEPFAQGEFLLALLAECKARGMATAIDTCGYAPPELVCRAACLSDLFLFDLKVMDEPLHRQLTGISNVLILANLQELVKRGARVVVRFPVIPGLTDAPSNIHQIGQYLAGIEAKELELIPYHASGQGKYQGLGRSYECQEIVPPSPQALEELAQHFSRLGVPTKIGGS